MRLLIAAFLVLVFLLSPGVAQITIDGNFSDWSGISAYVTDGTGEYSDPNLDLLTGYYSSDASNLFLRTDVNGTYYGTANAGDGYHIFIDTDASNSTGLNYGWWSMGADYMVEQVSGSVANLYKYTGTGSDWSWSFVASVNEAHSGASSELQIPFSDLGLGTGGSIYLQWSSLATWSDVDYMQDDLGGARTLAVVGTPSALKKRELHPVNLKLKQNYPNPFNPLTTIEFFLPNVAPARLSVLDLKGRVVLEQPVKVQNAGWHRVQIDMSNFASGVYLYRLQAGSRSLQRKMLLVK